MKLLLCCNSFSQINLVVDWLRVNAEKHSELFYKSAQHEITLLEMGYGGFQVGFHIANHLANNQYHLVLKASFANTFKENISAGEVVNIINDKPADTGVFVDEGFKDLYELNLLSINDKPHQMGGFVNKTNAYLNVFLPLRKVLSLSVNTASNDTALRALRVAKYNPHIETNDGINFAYTCLFRQQPFYHLSAVERNFVSGEKNTELAHKNLNESIIDIIQKI
jgi:hypothetical protein